MNTNTLLALVVVVVVGTACVADGAVVTSAQENLAVADVEALISANAARTAELVRLAFHDAVGVSPSGHKSDGCINLNNADNKGLIAITNTMWSLWASKQNDDLSYGDMSFADFIALAGATAARVGAARSAACATGTCIPPMPLVYGRVDCPTAPSTDQIGSFPNAQGGLSTVMTLFRDEMGLTDREVVALMGAHSLGDANADDSGGFRGPWTRDRNTLDNDFYIVLTQRTWAQDAKPVPNSPGATVHQWDAPAGGGGGGGGQIMMLNTDACLWRTIAPDSAGVVTGCSSDLATCPAQPTTTSIVSEYAADNAVWAADFGPAFAKLYSQGYGVAGLAAANTQFSNTVTPPTTTSPALATLPAALLATLLPVLAIVLAF